MTTTSQVPNGHFSLTIGGRTREGRIDMEGLCEIESLLDNVSLMDTISGQRNRWGFNTTCTVLFVGLKAVNPAITKKHVTTWIQTALDEGSAELADFTKASQLAAITALGVRVRKGTEDMLNDNKLPSVDEDGDDAPKKADSLDDPEVVDGGTLKDDKRPLPASKKNLRSA